MYCCHCLFAFFSFFSPKIPANVRHRGDAKLFEENRFTRDCHLSRHKVMHLLRVGMMRPYVCRFNLKCKFILILPVAIQLVYTAFTGHSKCYSMCGNILFRRMTQEEGSNNLGHLFRWCWSNHGEHRGKVSGHN